MNKNMNKMKKSDARITPISENPSYLHGPIKPVEVKKYTEIARVFLKFGLKDLVKLLPKDHALNVIYDTQNKPQRKPINRNYLEFTNLNALKKSRRNYL